jgi:hypothetical protein
VEIHEMHMKRVLIFGCIFGTMLVVLLCVGLTWAIFSWEDDFFFLDRNRPNDVSRIFMVALMENRGESAKSMVMPSQWARIDQWTTEHQSVSCPVPVGISDEPTWWSTDSKANSDGDVYRLSLLILSLPCPDENQRYRLTIEDISLRQTERGWLIEDWGQITEQW